MVTLVLTDVEGSTRLWEADADAMERALARHDAIISEAVQRHEGRLLKHKGEGDSAFAVFSRATSALGAALAMQRALASEHWPVGIDVRVRIAIHTAEVELRDGDYYGPAVNRTARLRGIAHGGQVVISQATAELVRDKLPEGASLIDLGAHRLPDLGRPEVVFGLAHCDFASTFPPLRSLEALPNNLPIQLTSFIGHEHEMVELKGLLGTNRLVTLTGAAGCGKTRLALQLGADMLDSFPDGVWLVDLAPLADPDLLIQEVATTLGVREVFRSTMIDALESSMQPARPLTDLVTECLRAKQLLLVLDNCEHLLESAAGLAETLLRKAPVLQILATSREALGVAGEASWRVRSLSVPDPAQLSSEIGANYEAVQLFVDRARSRLGTFAITPDDAPAVAQICRRLDGIPLAIELAAARVEVLSPKELATRLDDRFRLLTGGSRTGLERHQTLRAAVDWSYDALSTPERALLERLSVFAGGCSLEGAEEVCVGGEVEKDAILDLLAQLVGKSLVVADRPAAEARYRLLETIRQYAREKLLASGQSQHVGECHLQWCLALTARAERGVWGSEQATWFDVIELEEDNLRQALDWTITSGDAESALRLVGALGRFWMVRGRIKEGGRWLRDAVALEAREHPYLRAQALTQAGMIAMTYEGDMAAARSFIGEALSLFRELGVRRGIFWSLHSMAVSSMSEGNVQEATAYADEALEVARSTGHEQSIGYALLVRSAVALGSGDCMAAQALQAEALPIFRRFDDKTGIVQSLLSRGAATAGAEQWASSTQSYQECKAISREIGNLYAATLACFGLGAVALVSGDQAAARRHFEEAIEIGGDRGSDNPWLPTLLNGMGELELEEHTAGADTRFIDALEHCGTRARLGLYSQVASLLAGLAKAAATSGEFPRAARLFGAAEKELKAHPAGVGQLRFLLYTHLYEQQINNVRNALGEGPFAAEFTAGGAMSLPNAIDFATSLV
jgi:predicted ATPase/class 3 adenylate cyclase